MTSQQAKPASMRTAMPKTAEWVARMRAQWGKDHVDHCMRQAMDGQPGWFYAIEAGHVVGTPWGAGTPMDEYQRMAVLCGSDFAGFMREPTPVAEGGAHAAH